jgi:GT2 family glycosyltransferase
MTPSTPTVYIPTLNAGENLSRCLASLEQQTTHPHVVVADNGEGEGCSSLLRERFPQVARASQAIALTESVASRPTLS